MAEQQDMGYTPPSPPDPPGPQPAPRPPKGMGAAPEVQFTYIIYGTNQPYQGRVVEVGGQLYTTQGGALEGYSFQVMPRGGQNDPIPDIIGQDQTGIRPRPRPNDNSLSPFPFDGSSGTAQITPGGNQMTPIIPGKNPDDPMVDTGDGAITDEDGGIIIDDPMAPDPFANQGNMGG